MKKKKPEHRYKYTMLVDDSELDNFINQKMIEANHFAERIYVNTSATSALEFLHNLQVSDNDKPNAFPEVIFVDLNMPIMDGFQFITGLRQFPVVKKVRPKVVILTSSVSPKDRLRAAELGDGIIFLNKPLTKEMLEFI